MSGKHGEKGKSIWGKLREFLYGLAMHEAALVAIQKKAHFEHLFMLITMGNLLGVPIVPHYYTLRLLPYAVPRLAGWKRYMLREKDLTDKADFG
ncbi:MAG: hypothetical protein FJ118_14615 [Deltaproteobacteria bacterium]|nr:hypothetical protein [Deltaproteobacteria bacterium]